MTKQHQHEFSTGFFETPCTRGTVQLHISCSCSSSIQPVWPRLYLIKLTDCHILLYPAWQAEQALVSLDYICNILYAIAHGRSLQHACKGPASILLHLYQHDHLPFAAGVSSDAVHKPPACSTLAETVSKLSIFKEAACLTDAGGMISQRSCLCCAFVCNAESIRCAVWLASGPRLTSATDSTTSAVEAPLSSPSLLASAVSVFSAFLSRVCMSSIVFLQLIKRSKFSLTCKGPAIKLSWS